MQNNAKGHWRMQHKTLANRLKKKGNNVQNVGKKIFIFFSGWGGEQHFPIPLSSNKDNMS